VPKISEEHSKIGASQMHRVMGCPGSVALCEKAPPQRPSKDAEEGTKAHTVCERILKGAEPWELVGEVPLEMIEAAEAYVEHIKSLGEGKLLIEYKFHLERLDERAFGTADAVLIKDDEIHVIDYKYGAGHAVEVEDNPQLIFYALGVLEQYKRNKIHLWIIQPRAAHDDGPIRGVIMTRIDLAGWFVKFRSAIIESMKPDAELIVGDWCRWCQAFPICPAQGKIAIADAKHDFTAIEPIELPSGSLLTSDQISAVLKQKPIIEAWLKSVEEYAEQELAVGHDIPGFKVVAGRGSRSWADENEAKKFLLRELKGNAYESKLISIAKAEKYKISIPANLIKVNSGLPHIAPINDKRKAFKRDLSNEFGEVKCD